MLGQNSEGKIVHRVASILVLIGVSVCAANTHAQTARVVNKIAAKAETAYFECLGTYSKNFVQTPALPSDVATAAAVACDKEKAAIVEALIRPGGGNFSVSFEVAKQLVTDIEAEGKAKTVRAVIERRYLSPN